MLCRKCNTAFNEHTRLSCPTCGAASPDGATVTSFVLTPTEIERVLPLLTALIAGGPKKASVSQILVLRKIVEQIEA